MPPRHGGTEVLFDVSQHVGGEQCLCAAAVQGKNLEPIPLERVRFRVLSTSKPLPSISSSLLVVP
jgi:hypothetical protein